MIRMKLAYPERRDSNLFSEKLIEEVRNNQLS